MATYQQQVESYVGTGTNVDILSQFLTAGAQRVIELIPIGEARQIAKKTAIPSGGLDVTNSHLLEVTGNGYNSIEIPYGKKVQAEDVESIFYAVSKSPVHYFVDSKIFVLPSTSNDFALAVTYPTVLYSDSSVVGFPVDYDELIVLYSAIQVRIKQIEEARVALPADLIVPDVTAQFANLTSALDVDQDIELAMGYSNDIQTILANFASALSNFGAQLSKAQQKQAFLSASLVSLQQQYNDAIKIHFGVGNDSK
jgi:hypothetical protein